MLSQKITVVGGGVLGTQIGLMCAYVGKDVTVWLRSEDSVGRTRPKLERYAGLMLDDLQRAKALIGNPMGARLYPRGLIRDWASATPDAIDALTEAARRNFSQKVRIELDMARALADADIAIESMSEDPEAKAAVYRAMRDLMPPKTLLFTNSSTLLPSRLAQHTGRPERFCAVHFANLIWRNNTAEIMGHAGTDPEVIRRAAAFADEINMVPLVLKREQPGYILNALLIPLLDAAQALWASDVADVATIDRTWELATGAPMGPFRILDVVGLETAYNINRMKPDAQAAGSAAHRIGEMLRAKIDRGETGVNAGKGFYDYPDR